MLRFQKSLLYLALLLACGSSAYGKIGFRQVTHTFPVAVQRGTTAEVKLHSNFTLDETYAIFFDRGDLKMTFLETEPIKAPRNGRAAKGTPFRFRVETPAHQLPGVYEYRVATKQAVSSVAQILVTDFPVVLEEKKENGTLATAQHVGLPVALCGVCEKFEDVDVFSFDAQKGDELTFQIYAQRVTNKLHSMVVRGPRIYLMDPILTLRNPQGQVIAQNDNFYGGDSFLTMRIPEEGKYSLELRDARYAGDVRYTYCLEIAQRPYVHGVFPMAVQQNTAADLQLAGYHLGENASVSLQPKDTADAGWQLRRFDTQYGPSNPSHLLVSALPQIIEQEENNTRETATALPAIPLGVNGRLSETDDIDFYSFTAEKGKIYHLEVVARRRGSPLDSVLELYDDKGKRLVENDDIAKPASKDSRLFWTAPADGTFHLAIRDLHGRGGRRYLYHVRVEFAKPDFSVFGEYYYALLAPGTATLWFAKVERRNGFTGPIEIGVENLPPGVTATPVTIPSGMKHCGIILTAAADAKIDASLVRVFGKATLKTAEEKETEIVRYGHITCEQQSSGGGQARWPIKTQLVGVTKPLDLKKVTASPAEITLAPGGKVEIEVTIERAEDFKDAVSLAMSFDYFTTKFGEQLPPGVKVSTKSKARLTGNTLTGKLILEADKKALPVERLPIAPMARVSITFSITTNFASNPVWLTVTGGENTTPK